jgi:hypothetical protein
MESRNVKALFLATSSPNSLLLFSYLVFFLNSNACHHSCVDFVSIYTTANVVEGLFSVWLGYRCYDYLSHSPSTTTNSDTAPDSVDAIAALPLCRGRSKIAEALCPDWIDVTQHQIPKAYWNALDDGRLRDERTWRAIQRFSVNCERRKAAEIALRSKLSLKMDEPVALPTRLDDGGKHP